MATVSSGVWNRYLINQYEWKSVCNNNPISGLRSRNESTHSNFYYVASGINSYLEKEHCGGINQISFSLSEKINKVDSYLIRPKINSDEFEIALIDKEIYPDLHHIKNKELYKVFPVLDKSE